jgi:hypothetical protein
MKETKKQLQTYLSNKQDNMLKPFLTSKAITNNPHLKTQDIRWGYMPSTIMNHMIKRKVKVWGKIVEPIVGKASLVPKYV